MRKYNFRDLKDEFTFLELRATTLGSFCNPPSFTSDNKIKMNETTYFGDMIHAIVQTTLLGGPEKWKIVAEEIKNQIADYENYESVDNYKKFYKNIMNYYNLACQLRDSLPSPALMVEREYRIFLDCSWYKICFWGCFDVILEDWSVLDIKTSAGFRDEWREVLERQQYYYTLLRAWSQDQYEWSRTFRYVIFTKHSPPRMQIIERVIDIEKAEKILKEDLKSYLWNLHNKNEENKIQHGNSDWPIQEWSE